MKKMKILFLFVLLFSLTSWASDSGPPLSEDGQVTLNVEILQPAAFVELEADEVFQLENVGFIYSSKLYEGYAEFESYINCQATIKNNYMDNVFIVRSQKDPIVGKPYRTEELIMQIKYSTQGFASDTNGLDNKCPFGTGSGGLHN